VRPAFDEARNNSPASFIASREREERILDTRHF
jgi:hypothetical protein